MIGLALIQPIIQSPFPLSFFYDVNLSLGVEHTPEALYLHAHWRREASNVLGQDFVILPAVPGAGRFLGCNVGVIAALDYGDAWLGAGEVNVWFGDDEQPTLCGTGSETKVRFSFRAEYSNEKPLQRLRLEFIPI